MESKFSPGPWKIAGRVDAPHPGIDSANMDQSIILFGFDDEQCGIRGATQEERNANAFLISAAPDLLESLEAILKVAQERWRSLPATSHEKNCLSSARAAIKKAYGNEK